MLQNLPDTCDDLICNDLSPAALAALASTCNDANGRVKSYQTRGFSLDHLLAPFFTTQDVLKFRVIQSKTDAVISGSTAVQFFARTRYPMTDLDIYVPHQHAYTIGAWLQEIGYQYQRSTRTLDFALAYLAASADQFPVEPDLYPQKGISAVFSFKNHGQRRGIHLISVEYSPLEAILQFHSTCVMNFIAYDHAVSLYPDATFEKHVSLICHADSPEHDAARAKYQARGWKMINNLSATECTDLKSDFCVGHRFVSDKHCWTIPLGPILTHRMTNFEANSWTHGYDPVLQGRPVAYRLNSPTSSARYLVAHDDIIRPPKLKNAYSDDEDIGKVLAFYNINLARYH
ncbi:hypothetical protein Hypma_009675 [Hypsizygus marmoreus]|uniref:Uncharacterized protein n=1 Tax=Hypsizygus marmoreus TaxID=39966 RepID=A0A369JP89_HYPMA|nr:hypothetical protein Hypma_009675 [Hypsizygus marmoreus]